MLLRRFKKQMFAEQGCSEISRHDFNKLEGPRLVGFLNIDVEGAMTFVFSAQGQRGLPQRAERVAVASARNLVPRQRSLAGVLYS